ncbi:hypothetical protein [Sinorhizobium meliloti]|uniref:hypothetical protein n=1 Tax=Rhizobium meliloti TaxID=382 RepID=UPI000B4A377D|nr:hypothetical protein [Sinorhizobium meliloti]ASP93315.1 hypothetical protein CDO25_18980 [Sinorhizobium meliloti]MQX56103.1 hypothetical protein [Sinorhizobium meliloti]MQX57797.1 hypothetical protein [Sinorhizobium meliloti]
MTRIGIANSNDHDFGVEIVNQGEEFSLMFRSRKDRSVQGRSGTRPSLKRQLEDQLWLWTEAVAAHVG